MPLQKLQFRPGINRDVTSLSNEGGWVDCDRIRFRLGYPEKIGGWEKYSRNQYQGSARALHNWIALDGSNFLGIGTHLKYYIEEGGGFNDITPIRDTAGAGNIEAEGNLQLTVSGLSIANSFTFGETVTGGTSNATARVNKFITDVGVLVDIGSIATSTFKIGETLTGGSSSASGTITAISGSSTVTINDTNHGAIDNDFVTISGTTSLGGNITNTVLNQEHQIVKVEDSVRYEIVTSATSLYGAIASVSPSGTSTGSATFTSKTQSSTSGNGFGAEFTVVASSGSYNVTVTAAGLNYVGSQTITITGDNLGGTTPANDLTITVSSVTSDSADGDGSNTANATYQINVGLDSMVGGTGWGSSTWGRGTWGSASALTTITDLRVWTHDNFGEDLLICPRDSNIFYWDKTQGVSARAVELSVATTGAASGTKTSVPQVAKQILVSDTDRHVIAFGCDGLGANSSATQGDGVQDPLLIRFSDQENPIDWFPTSTNTAGDLIIGSGSQFVQALETKREILVWTDASLHSLRFIGPPFTFGITQLASNTTIMGPNAAAATEDFVFWMGLDNFYTYAGQTQQLDCPVKDKVFQNFNFSQSDKVFAGVNSEYNEVFWFYPSQDNSLANNGTGQNDRYVVYNYKDQIWYFGNLARTAWVDRGVRKFPLAAESGYVYNHEFGHDDDGSAMSSFIESAPMDLGDGDRFTFVSKLIPDITFRGSTNISTPQATFSVKTRDNPGSNFTTTSSGVVSRTATLPVEEHTDQLNFRARGRSFAFRVDSTSLGSKWKLGSPRVDIRQDGRR